MGKSELRAELIRFCDSIRNYEHESGHSIYQDERESSELVDIFLALPNYYLDESEDDSKSPDIEKHDTIYYATEFNTLQPGDWFQGTEEDYRKVLDVYFDYSGKYLDAEKVSEIGYLLAFRSVRTNRLVLGSGRKLTQLTPEEFLRRAENTFKK